MNLSRKVSLASVIATLCILSASSFVRAQWTGLIAPPGMPQQSSGLIPPPGVPQSNDAGPNGQNSNGEVSQGTITGPGGYQMYPPESDQEPYSSKHRMSSQQHASVISIRQVGGGSYNAYSSYGSYNTHRSSSGKTIEITLHSEAPFETQNQQLMLIIGAMHFTNYHYKNGDQRTIVFTMDKSTFDALPDGSVVKVGFGLQRGMRWDAGTLHKSMLQTY